MKTRIALPILAFIALGLNLSSCKKTDNTSTETSAEEKVTTTDLAGNQAISDNLAEDANNVFMKTASDKSLPGARPMSPVGCGTITVTPAIGFPKTITIDYGTGCTDSLTYIGIPITRSGIITIVVNDTLGKVGSKSVMTFSNYIVNGFKLEGTVTWTCIGTRSWTREVTGGKTTNTLTNVYWLYSGTKTITQIGGIGSGIPPRVDDVFSITGTHSVTNMAGRTRTCTIDDSNPLIKANNCPFIQKGSMKMQGPNHYAIIDFGSGTCDANATISIDGGTAIPFILK